MVNIFSIFHRMRYINKISASLLKNCTVSLPILEKIEFFYFKEYTTVTPDTMVVENY